MLTELFRNSRQVKILAFFFADEPLSHSTGSVSEVVGVEIGQVKREISRLTKVGILQSSREGELKYRLNPDWPFYFGLKHMLKAYQEENRLQRWVLYEEMPGYYPLVVADAWNVKRANAYFQSIELNCRFSGLLTVYNEGICALWLPENEFRQLCQGVLDKILTEPGWAEAYVRLVMKRHRQMDKEVAKLSIMDLPGLSNPELYQLFQKYFRLYEDLHILHWVQTGADAGESILSQYLLAYLKKRIWGHRYSLGKVFSVLTTPTTDSNNGVEYKELLQLFQEKPDDPESLRQHQTKWGWLGYGTAGPGWDLAYFNKLLQEWQSENIIPAVERKRLERERRSLKAQQTRLQKELAISEDMQRVFAIARDLIYSKNQRKDSIFYYSANMEAFYREIGRRFGLSLEQVRFLYPPELRELLVNGSFEAAKLRQRPRQSLYYSTGSYEEDLYLEGERVERLLEGINFKIESVANTKVFFGNCASAGRVRGIVAIINTSAEIKKIQPGDILVSTVTSPNLVPAMKKAAAIVTDAGGITCHAAIISRDLGVPCVVGTKIATKVLKDGDLVEVDATHGKVTVLKKAEAD